MSNIVHQLRRREASGSQLSRNLRERARLWEVLKYDDLTPLPEIISEPLHRVFMNIIRDMGRHIQMSCRLFSSIPMTFENCSSVERNRHTQEYERDIEVTGRDDVFRSADFSVNLNPYLEAIYAFKLDLRKRTFLFRCYKASWPDWIIEKKIYSFTGTFDGEFYSNAFLFEAGSPEAIDPHHRGIAMIKNVENDWDVLIQGSVAGSMEFSASMIQHGSDRAEVEVTAFATSSAPERVYSIHINFERRRISLTVDDRPSVLLLYRGFFLGERY